MFSKVFLAQTIQEMEQFLPPKTAYMACHFSPYNAGLSNLPKQLPKGSLLLVDDSMPVQDHDSALISRQLQEIVEAYSIHAVVLDFQREQTNEAFKMIRDIIPALPCPVAVPVPYGKDLACPVLLPPVPLNKALKEYISPWLQQGAFLEIGTDAAEITVTAQGSSISPLLPDRTRILPLEDQRLHCHYQVEVTLNKAAFTLQRDLEDLAALTDEAYRLGALGVLGLYQELSK